MGPSDLVYSMAQEVRAYIGATFGHNVITFTNDTSQKVTFHLLRISPEELSRCPRFVHLRGRKTGLFISTNLPREPPGRVGWFGPITDEHFPEFSK